MAGLPPVECPPTPPPRTASAPKCAAAAPSRSSVTPKPQGAALAEIGIELTPKQMKRAADPDAHGKRKLPLFVDPIDKRLKIERGILLENYMRCQDQAERSARASLPAPREPFARSAWFGYAESCPTSEKEPARKERPIRSAMQTRRPRRAVRTRPLRPPKRRVPSLKGPNRSGHRQPGCACPKPSIYGCASAALKEEMADRRFRKRRSSTHTHRRERAFSADQPWCFPVGRDMRNGGQGRDVEPSCHHLRPVCSCDCRNPG